MKKGAVAYVDGSFMGKQYGAGVYFVHSKDIYEISGVGDAAGYVEMKNVGGEIIASMLAIQKAQRLGVRELTIYYDYLGIGKWANNEWNANKKETQAYKEYVKNARKSMKIDFVKVKAHSGNQGNQRADYLARKLVKEESL